MILDVESQLAFDPVQSRIRLLRGFRRIARTARKNARCGPHGIAALCGDLTGNGFETGMSLHDLRFFLKIPVPLSA